ncbi:putative porin [Flavicella marina]|uniref:putative porin n=1 Tax=Flavicella marina TaxID=1475951 RepID=UPI001264DE0A|nr:putative porin [Flavicella marina]
MKKFLFTLYVILFSLSSYAQEKDSIQEPEIYNLDALAPKKGQPLAARSNEKDDGVKVDPESGKTDYKLYKIITHEKDTVLVDTTLSIQSQYEINYLRKDLFGKHAFQNQGQVLTQLTYDYNDQEILPRMGQTPRHETYNEIEDVAYYKVPTPTTEIMYRNGIEQGQVLDSKIAINVSETMNFSLGYTGLRSLGAYRSSLSSFKNFVGTFSYQSKNDRYRLRFHNTNQRIENQENGGLTEIAQGFFEANDSEYSDRGRLDVNLEDASSVLNGKRYYVDHNFKLFTTKDTIPKKISNIKLGHIFNYETKQFNFLKPTSTDYFGNYFSAETNDMTSYKSMDNKAYMDFTSPYLLGKFRAIAGYHYYYQGYRNVVNTGNGTIPNQIKNDAVSIGANWKAAIKTIHLNASASTIIAGSINGNNLFVEAAFKNSKKVNISASLQLNSKAPNVNYQFFQSNFIEYNWSNNFKNINTRNLNFNLATKWIQATASLTQIEDFVYFNEDAQAKPTQHNETINYFKLRAHNEIKVGYFALDTDFIYQNVASGANVYKVPDAILRSTFYFSKVFFEKKSLYLQTGIIGKYFTSYQANNYNPVLGEFTLQQTDFIGGKPIFDAFINAQIRRTRLYFTFENLMQLTGKNYYYSTPNKPYTDFKIKFGFVWNFFK